MRLSTIGYEGSTLEDFIATLKAAGVRRILDIRELPISRRKGFAKTALSAALESAGITYVHLKGLGDPKEGREAARANDRATFLRVYRKQLKTPVAIADMEKASSIAAQGAACLLCYERDPATCHRSLVAQIISDTLGASIKHLGVRHGISASTPTRTGPNSR